MICVHTGTAIPTDGNAGTGIHKVVGTILHAIKYRSTEKNSENIMKSNPLFKSIKPPSSTYLYTQKSVFKLLGKLVTEVSRLLLYCLLF